MAKTQPQKKTPMQERKETASMMTNTFLPFLQQTAAADYQSKLPKIDKLYEQYKVTPEQAEERKWREESLKDYTDKRSLAEKKKEAFKVLIPRLMAAGITSPKALSNIMAQIQHESAYSYQSAEKPNYSAERFAQLKGTKYGLPPSDERKETKEQYLARLTPAQRNILETKIRPITNAGGYEVMQEMYGSSAENEGVPHAGVANRGRGYTMLTKRANYKKIQEELARQGKTYDIVADPTLIQSSPEIGADVAVAFYTRGKKDPNAYYEDIDRTHKTVRFDGYDKPNEGNYQARVKTAANLLPEIEQYMKTLQPPPKPKVKVVSNKSQIKGKTA